MNQPARVATVSPSSVSTIPRRDEQTGPWFDALAEGVLTVRFCTGCGHRSRPDATTCPACHSDELDWVPAGGTGAVVSLVVEHTDREDQADSLSLGLVELDEGPWLHARFLDHPAIGERVGLVVLAVAGGEPIPAFRRL